MRPIPFTLPGVWPSPPAASRFAASIRSTPGGCRVALLGLPDDEGVRLNNGRPGAKEGPRALREALASYGVASPDGIHWPPVFDAGDIVPGNSLVETHQRVTDAVRAIMSLSLFPIAIGGGHDLTFSFVRGVIGGGKPLAGVYFDAHLDVRAEPGSGMPFRSLVEHCGVTELHVLGINPLANSAEHTNWFRSHGGVIHPAADAISAIVREEQLPTTAPCFVSFDLDVLDSAHAPGVSARNPAGWSTVQAERWVAAAGRSEQVRCFDIMELSPPHDQQGRTARVAAHLLLTFLRGFSERGA